MGVVYFKSHPYFSKNHSSSPPPSWLAGICYMCPWEPVRLYESSYQAIGEPVRLNNGYESSYQAIGEPHPLNGITEWLFLIIMSNN